MIGIVLVFVFSTVFVNGDTVTIETGKGVIQGYKNVGYNTFFGVPYARVDEENPFGNSLEYSNFNTPFNANDSTIICPQVYFSEAGTVQCLRLNIYVPNTANTSNLRPILVWFHGGGFAFGSAGEYGGQHLVKHDTIVITVNYRLGPYGFLCLDDSHVPGNQGLKDQIAALRWIKKNIAAFGGDTSKVTIAGESYGGGGVDLHLYSKYETLFDKAVIQSGSVFAEGFYVKPDYEAAIKLAKKLGHNVNGTKEALKVLAKEKPVDLMTATRELNLTLSVCKEKKFDGVQNFVTENPFELLNPERIRNSKILIGYNSQELLYAYVDKPQEFYDKSGDVIYKGLEKNFVMKPAELEILSDIVKRFYLGGKPIGPETMLELSDMSSDFAVNNPAERSINKYIVQGAKVYKYLFSYIGGSPYKNISGTGAMHTEELKYVFDWNSQKISGTEQEMMRDRMTTMWANFVKFGNPTPKKTDLLPVTWEPVSGTSRQCLNIDVDMSMRDHVYHDRIAFWDLFWQNYQKKYVVLN